MKRFIIFLIAFNAWIHCLGEPSDLVILEENVHIRISGLKPGLTHFLVEKEIIFEVLTEEGAARLREFTLPEPLDEAYLSRSPEDHNLGFFISEVKVREFTVEFKSGYDRWVERKPKVEYLREPVLADPQKGYTQCTRTRYKLPLVKKGEVVRIHYKWSAPMLPNLSQLGSNYIYHHGKHAKKLHVLTFEYPKNLEIELEYFNGDTPADVVETTEGTIQEVWRFRDLPASLSEPGIRPYASLPYIGFCLKNYALFHPYINAVMKRYVRLYWPLPYLAAVYRNRDFYSDEMSIRVGSTSRQFVALTQFVDRFKPASGSAYEHFVRIHNEIALNFDYDKDTKVYDGTTPLPPGFGESLLENTLHDLFRYRSYNALLHQTGCSFFSAYLCDRNHAVSDLNFLKPHFTGDYLFAMTDDEGKIHFAYPKCRRSGYFIDELPFYFEDTRTTLLSYLNPLDFEPEMNALDVAKFRIINTPGSNASENARTVNSLVTFGSGGKLSFQTQMTLNGQFSTMLRPLYLHDEMHNGVNPAYNKPFWELSPKTTLVTHNAEILTTRFPFTTKVTAAYDLPLATDTAGYYVLEIGQWMKHIYHTNTDSSSRSMDYYPDFTCQDRFAFQLRLEQPATEVELPNLIHADNHYGYYQLEVTTQDNQVFTILSSYIVKSPVVPLASIGEVIEVNQALEEGRKAVIRLR